MAKDPNFDMMQGNDYSPSKRASSAQRIATGRSGYNPDKADDGTVKTPKDADQPSNQHTGGKPARNDQTNAQSMTEPTGQGRGPVERSDHA